jgi:mannitol 2-dehydrogenase
LKRGGRIKRPIKLPSYYHCSLFRYLHGLDESGKEMPMLDPIAPKLRKRAKAAAKAAHPLLASVKSSSENSTLQS